MGISYCDLLMLGTAGKGRGLENAQVTAALENEIKPTKILLNTMSAFERTVLDKDIQDGRFIPATEKEILQEEYAFLQALELLDTYFWAIVSRPATDAVRNGSQMLIAFLSLGFR